MRWIALPTPLLVAAALATTPAAAQVNPTIPAARDTTPVVLSGKDLGSWAVPSNQTAQPPLMDFADCPYTVNPDQLTDDEPWGNGGDNLTEAFEQNCPDGYDPHNKYADPLVDTADVAAPAGVPVHRMLAYRWDADAGRFVQIPFQVDEAFTRYLDNSASGFAIYSGQDQHTTYAYDREGFRFTDDGPADDPCRAQQHSPTAADPVAGLDHNDEVAFMASDAGPLAPVDAKLPKGIEKSQVITVADPQDTAAPARFVYLAVAAPNGPKPAFNGSNGYVRYERDANADDFAFSESSYDNYGNAAPGYYCDEHGQIVRNADDTPKIGRRRPRDTATITTSRYRFRYDGRWLMTKVEISGDGGETYGPDLVDRWKARAFAQDPESENPCCGYEEEDNNWGGSSTLLGEKVGPVRAIRETWGADSGTNVIRRETFYRDEMKQKTWLRVHVIPPLDGIYAQWDFNAGRVDRFYNSRHADGVAIDGRNDELYGNFDDPCNPNYDGRERTDIDQGYRDFYQQMQLCRAPNHLSVDAPDLTFGDPNAGTDWSMVAGADGSIVDRITTSVDGATPGGVAQSVAAVPYYRDDSCFDDGTGDNPGIDVAKRERTEPRVRADGVTPRRCWAPSDGIPEPGTDEFFQGSIATHGLHLLFLAESDNARQTVPINEIVSEWQMVMLPGRQDATAGERYGRAFEKPLVATAREAGAPAAGDEAEPCPEGQVRGEDGACREPEPEPCPEGQTRNAEGDCQPNEPEPCPEGQVRGDDGQCHTPEPEPCPEGQVRGEDGQCHTPEPEPEPCPEGQVRREDGKCKKPKDNPSNPNRAAETPPAEGRSAASGPAAQQRSQRPTPKRRCAKARIAKTRAAKRRAQRRCARAARRASRRR